MKNQGTDPLQEERSRRMRARNWAVFLTLLAFVILVFAITIIKLKTGAGA